MHDLDKPYTDSIQQWDIACDCFKSEFKFDPNEIVTIDTIREMFAEIVYEHVSEWLYTQPANKYKNLMGDEYPRVRLVSAEVFEHAGNSAIYEG